MTEIKTCKKPGCSLYAAPDSDYCFMHKKWYPDSRSANSKSEVSKKKSSKKKLK